MSKILVLNGPNLNLLGRREPGIYGTTTLQECEASLSANAPDGTALEFFQSNHEGQMIDRIHRVMDEPIDGIIINPGAWTHSSVAIRDALSAVAAPFVEVHISNVHAREAFRHHSYLSDIALAVIAGCGMQGYTFALQTLNQSLKG
ncbi:MAG: type II 3-dehydroquinate dehydratase [Pseudomonadota bacterium]|nr:type II 3-dehydroquinate dehydratase [Pseudomonadota bacterium]MEE2821160.1 type II 3-dehydroquinate dehydratase [Pseudomonadota bacterium]